jgi:hypothetical protein
MRPHITRLSPFWNAISHDAGPASISVPHSTGGGPWRAIKQGMKDEMAFLKYRRVVIQAWPDSLRKQVFLAAIESRMTETQRQVQMISAATLRLAPAQ